MWCCCLTRTVFPQQGTALQTLNCRQVLRANVRWWGLRPPAEQEQSPVTQPVP